VVEGGETKLTLVPERRFYPVERSQTTEAAIHTTWFADLYLVLGEGDPSGRWTVRAYHNPLVPWIWVGAVVMALGGMVSLTDRRLRIGAPRRAAGRSASGLSGAAAAGE
jgi:cytochrome c-type biogenesis protein CcmF